MPGPAPKPKSQRRTRHEPRRGDWVTLPSEPLKNPPGLPKPAPSGGYGAHAKRAWERWWASPMAHMWDESDHSAIEMLVRMLDEWHDDPSAAMASQIRQYSDNLGLTPKGRQDRRWALPDSVQAEAEVRPLRSVSNGRPLAVDPNA